MIRTPPSTDAFISAACRLSLGAVLLLAPTFPTSAQTITGTNPVKIFILAGESNMNGKGRISSVTTRGSLDYITANDPDGNYQFLKSGGNYVTRADVGIRNYSTIAGQTPPALAVGNLTVGYGDNSTFIGPELGFGHVTGDVYENKVLLVKVGVDAATLANSFCPPSSRVGVPAPVLPGDKGFYYNEILRLVNEAKTSLGATPHEIAGFGWHQGWNDRSVDAMSAVYETNMTNFINNIRAELGIPDLPFVIASAGMDGNPGVGYSEVEKAQLKMATVLSNVAVVDTRAPYDGLEFWQIASQSPKDEGYHWNQSGKSYLHIGLAMGDALSLLAPGRIPYRPRASSGPGGVTLTWKNGTEIPASVRVLRNGVEIAAAAPVNPPTFLDSSAPLGVNNYELQFTMPGNPCPPLTVRHNGGITGLKGNQRSNGIKLTWSNNRAYTGITVKRDGTVIAASLPGTATSHTDPSPPTGSPTYSVEPVEAGSSPAEVLVRVSAAPAGGAVIYEPFDLTEGTALKDKNGGIGLDGLWDTGPSNAVATGSLSYGTLPTFGNSIVRSDFGGNHCSIQIGSTLADAGLLADGAELWFSFLHQEPNNSNQKTAFILGNDILLGESEISYLGSGIGVRIGNGNSPRPMAFNAGTKSEGTAQGTLATSQTALIVGKITWGANPTAPDTIEIYTPGTNLVLDTPTSRAAVLDQSNFNVISFYGSLDAPKVDEIRLGATYQDVIGQGADTSNDFTPPTPATMSFASAPAATSTTAITMTATTATDANGVQYFFDETSGNPGGTDSGWQDSPVYSDTGLNPNTQYTYTVQARDKSVNNNSNTASAPASATTLPPDTNPPPTPGFATAPTTTSSSAITMTAASVTDPEGGAVQYFFDETSGNPGGTDSGWQTSPAYTDTGLSPSTQYTYTVKARDTATPPNESAASSPSSATTRTVATVSTVFKTSGMFTPPAGVTSITVECWGGGGAGGSASYTTTVSAASGGGGGAYKKGIVSVTPGTSYTVTIPARATAPTSGFTDGQQSPNGSAVTFTGDNSSVTANGGTGGRCAVNANQTTIAGVRGTGDKNGGNGAVASASASGGGGGGPSDQNNGGNASAQGAGTGGTTTTGTDWAGGTGGVGRTSSTGSNGGNGSSTAPGGGGGGARAGDSTIRLGGSGGSGQIIITYTVPDSTLTVTGSLSALATTYGTASGSSSVTVSGSGLTADITATAQDGYQVSSDGATWGSTATFTQSGGTASGTLSVRFAATRAAGTYNSATAAVLSSTGVASANVTTASSGNVVNPAPLTITAIDQTKGQGQALVFGGGSTLFTSNGLQNGETIGTVTLACGGGAPGAAAGTYPITPSGATGGTFAIANYNPTYNNGTLTVIELKEYAFGTTNGGALVLNSEGKIATRGQAPIIQTTGGSSVVTLTYARRKNSGCVFDAQFSGDLNTWLAANDSRLIYPPSAPAGENVVDNGDEMEIVSINFPAYRNTGSGIAEIERNFCRIVIIP